MKKNIFRLIVAGITFFIGLAAVAFIYLQFNPLPKVSQNDSLIEIENVCTFSQSFPGKSEKISEIKKDRMGYFPSKSWNGYETLYNFKNNWYGMELVEMREESLLKSTNENAEIYRFLWLRTFHHPISVRIEKNNGEVKLFTKELDGEGGYDPGKLIRNKELKISDGNFCKFLNLIDNAGFWQMPTENDLIGNDGANWVLEGVRDNRYHIVDRWSPRDGNFREACIFLLKLSGINIDELKDDLY